jgi:hypothetical protein
MSFVNVRLGLSRDRLTQVELLAGEWVPARGEDDLEGVTARPDLAEGAALSGRLRHAATVSAATLAASDRMSAAHQRCSRWWAVVETRGIEPLTPALQRRCSAN